MNGLKSKKGAETDGTLRHQSMVLDQQRRAS